MPDAQVVDEFEPLRKFLHRKANLAEMIHKGKISFSVSNLSQEAWNQLIDAPDEFISKIQVAFTECGGVERAPVEIMGHDYHTSIKNVGTDQIGKFLSIPGIVRSVSEIRPRMIKGEYRCEACGRRTTVTQTARQIRAEEKPPLRCSGCQSRQFLLLEEGSAFDDTQIVVLSDAPEGLSGGEQPQQIVIEIWGDLCGRLFPGDRVTLSGILRVRKSKNIIWFDKYLELNSIAKSGDAIDLKVSEDEAKEIAALSNDKQVISKIVDSIAPSIYGLVNVKKAVAMQLFGGVPTKKGTDNRRGDIHVLLVGDPGVAKSQLILSAYHLSPRGIYTSGKNTSAAGLTAAAVKDENTGRWTLEAGALVFADGGMCAVDEIDKMNSHDRSALHEAMEQQSISVAKAGINAILRTRCSLLAAANPKLGRFNMDELLPPQINLSPPLLSRFDLIYIMRDTPIGAQDGELASHILDVHDESKNGMEHLEAPINPILLRKYISEAKKIRPKMTKEGRKVIQDYYVNMRAKVSKDSPVPITARQLESLIRLSQAHARMRMSKEVTTEDATMAVSVLENSLKDVAFDPSTGQMDIGRIDSGVKWGDKGVMDMAEMGIRKLMEKNGRVTPYDLKELLFAEKNIAGFEVERIIELLEEHRRIYRPQDRTIKLVNP